VTVEDDSDQAAPPPRQRKIIHVDMDAFYASVEQRDHPDLRGKPVAVGGSRERRVVAAASYEARKFGVRSAMPSVTAKRQCPDLIFVKPRFEVYKAVSQQIREIFAEHTPIIEPLSLDEAYLDVSENLQGIPLARDVALAIRAKIKDVTGLNASAGISYNKFLAKLASDHRKPNGQYVITPDMGPAFVEALPVGKFHGIGPATSTKINALGLYTGLDMRNQSLEFMQTNFGKAGNHYYWISRGVDNREVRADRIRKSVGAENTFSTNLTEFDSLVAELAPLVDKVWRYCESTGNRGRTVTLKVKFNDFEIMTRSRSIPAAVSTRQVVGNNRITDGTDNPLGLHRPGFRIPVVNDRRAVRDAYAKYETGLVNAYRVSDGEAQCPDCDGSGEDDDGETCATCHGRGTVSASERSSFGSGNEGHRSEDSRSVTRDQAYRDYDQALSSAWQNGRTG
jgi:DNA polymerase IV